MLRKFKKQWREFRRRPPGERFKIAYRQRQQSREKSLFRRVLGVVAALIAFALGVVFSLIPGIPGFVFFFVGAVLLAAESFRAARFLDWLELKLRAGWTRLRRGSRRKVMPAGLF